MSGERIHNIEEGMAHYVDEVICVRCAYRYIATWPVTTYMKHMVCQGCGHDGGIIATGDPKVRMEAGK